MQASCAAAWREREAGIAFATPAVWTTDIQEKHATALIQTTFEFRLDCTVKQALQGYRRRRTEESMGKVGGCCEAGMPDAIEAQEEAQDDTLYFVLKVVAEARLLLRQGRETESGDKLEEHVCPCVTWCAPQTCDSRYLPVVPHP